MKFTFLSTALGAAFLSTTAVANTPDLCTADIEDLRIIKPSSCDPTDRVGPDIKVGSTVYTNNEDHFVIGSPAKASSVETRKLKKAKKGKTDKKTKNAISKIINVYLPGTTDWPALSSCLLQSVAAKGVPTIGLTYGYLSRGDGFRNTRCGSLAGTAAKVECLKEQHNDAIYGGTYGGDRIYNDAEFWAPVDHRDAIAGRLGLLLAELHELYPLEGWDHFYSPATGSYPESLPSPKWDKITFVGHSQGAGHAAYLAATKKIHGAVMLSGPQDECVNCPTGTKFWIDDKFSTGHTTAFAFGDDSEDSYEPTLPIMKANWERMGTFEAGFEVANIDMIVDIDVCKAPVVSSIQFQPTSPCGRQGHCSTALDDSAPVLATMNGKNVYAWAIDLWSTLADVSQCVSK